MLVAHPSSLREEEEEEAAPSVVVDVQAEVSKDQSPLMVVVGDLDELAPQGRRWPNQNLVRASPLRL